MTDRRTLEDLTLPEPARTLLGRTRAILDAHVTPRTPDRSGWRIGGGTILAARWRHRESRDIDLLVHPRTETRFLNPRAAPELHRRLAAAGATKIGIGRFSRILFEESRIEMLAAEPQPQVGHQRAIVDGEETTVLASSQILTGKFSNRSLNPPVRDLYDLAVAGSGRVADDAGSLPLGPRSGTSRDTSRRASGASRRPCRATADDGTA